MASGWRRIGRQLGDIVLREGPRILKGLQNSGARPGKKTSASAPKPGKPSRPVPPPAVPTAQRARAIAYAPELDGRADPGEIVWTWVAYEEDAGQGKDRPVLVVGREGDTLLGLMLSSNSDRDGQRNWFEVGTGSWDSENRPSWVRLDRVLDVPESGIRREGAILDKGRFEKVAARLRSEYRWT